MRAVVVAAGGGVELAELPEPTPASDAAVVAVHSCGICGSDVHAAAGGMFPPGHTLGHEISGTVTRLGSQVRSLSEGDRVTVNPLGGCGACPACAKGLPFACANLPNIGIDAPGGFAELLSVPAAQLTRLPEEMEIEDGAHVEPLSVALHGLALAEAAPGEDSFVFGVGPIGLNVIIGLRATGAGRIVAVGRSPARRRAAERLGADLVLDSREADYPEVLQSLAGSFAHGFECAGKSDALTACLGAVAVGGTVVQLGLVTEAAPVDLLTLVGKGIRLVGSCAFGPETFARSIGLVCSRPEEVAALVTERVTLEAAPEAFSRLLHPGESVGVLVQPWREMER